MKINCQNPNTTTTQPNLNQSVGFDTIIAFHIYAVEPPIYAVEPPQELNFS